MKKLLFSLAGLLFSLAAVAQDFKITHGPYLCDMTRDGVTVVWTTSKPALSWVEVAPGASMRRSMHAITRPSRAADWPTEPFMPCGSKG